MEMAMGWCTDDVKDLIHMEANTFGCMCSGGVKHRCHKEIRSTNSDE